MFLRDYIRRAAINFGSDIAFVDARNQRTWREMDQRSDRLATALQGFGVQKGQATAILAHNRIELAEHWFAGLKIGTVRTGVNWRYSLREKLHTIRDCDSRVVFIEARCVEEMNAHLDELAAEGRILVGIGEGHGLPLDYEKLIASVDTKPVQPELHDDDIAMYGYTSGTTGNPKGVILTHRNVLIATTFNAMVNNYRKEDVRLYVTNPAGININAVCWNLLSGMKTVIDDFNVNRFLDQIEEHRVSQLTVVPTMLRRILDEIAKGRHDVSSLRQIAYGTMPATPSLIREAYNTLGCTLLNRYGVSESTGATALLDDEGHKLALKSEPELLLSVGKSMPHAEISIRDDAGAVLPFGELGTVWMRGDTMMKGYLNLPDVTEEALPAPGWLRTGDYGRMDDRGYIFLGDRKSHMIVTGGFNVYPIVVENVLAEHEAVREVVVVGVEHPDWGEAIVAAVTVYPGSTVSGDELINYCKPKLAKFEVPKHVEIVDSLPTGNTDKLNKRAVKDNLVNSGKLTWLKPALA